MVRDVTVYNLPRIDFRLGMVALQLASLTVGSRPERAIYCTYWRSNHNSNHPIVHHRPLTTQQHRQSLDSSYFKPTHINFSPRSTALTSAFNNLLSSYSIPTTLPPYLLPRSSHSQPSPTPSAAATTTTNFSSLPSNPRYTLSTFITLTDRLTSPLSNPHSPPPHLSSLPPSSTTSQPRCRICRQRL